MWNSGTFPDDHVLIGIANKEVLVAAGDVMTRAATDHGGEILPVDSEHNAVHQALRCGERGEVQRVVRRPLVVVAVRVCRYPVRSDLAVAVARQREEHGRPERLAVRRGVGLADRGWRDRTPGQVGRVLAAPG